MKKVIQIAKLILPISVTSLLFLGQKSFSIDETYSYYISHSFPTLVSTAWNDEINMWLYYAILHFWLYIGHSDVFMRALSALFAIATVPVMYKIGEYIFNKKAANIACILLSLHFFFITYAQEARSYTLLIFLLSLSTYYFLRFKENKSNKILYVIVSALAVYAHVFAGFVLLSQALYLLAHRKFKSFFLSFATIGIAILPLLISPALHSHSADWITKPSLYNLASTFFLLGGEFLPLVLLYGTLFSFAFIKSLKTRKYDLFLSWIFVPIFSVFLISQAKPIYESFYFVICLPPFIFLVSDVLAQIKKRAVFYIILSSMLILSLIRLAFWYQNTADFITLGKYRLSFYASHTENWRQATEYISKYGRPEDAAIFYGYYGKLDYDFYKTEFSPKIVEIASSDYELGGGSKLPRPNTVLLTSFTYPKVWFVVYKNTWGNPANYYEIEALLNQRYERVNQVNFASITVEEFTKR